MRKLLNGLVLLIFVVTFTACNHDTNEGVDGAALDTTPPTVTTTSPVDGATAVEIDSVITVTFSEPINPASVTTLSFFLTGPNGVVPAQVAASGDTATLTVSTPLVHKTEYTVTLTSAVEDAASPANALAAEMSWKFTSRALWTQQLGTSANDSGYGVMTDVNGNVYVAGTTFGDLDGRIHAGSADLFVTKYNSKGDKQWTQQLGTSSGDNNYGVASDDNGNVYLAGSTQGDLDGNTSAGGYDLFVVKFNSAGDKQWTRQLGTVEDDNGKAVATDISGNVFVAGYSFGGLDGKTHTGSADLFVSKYNSDGVKQWTSLLGTSVDDIGKAVATDMSGNVYVSGYTFGALDGNTSAGGEDLFVVKYDTDGVKQWTRQHGTTGDDYGAAMTTDANGNVYVAGWTDGDLDGANAGSWDLLVTKYNTTGDIQWSRQLGTSLSDIGLGVTTDDSASVYVAGHTSGELDGNTTNGDTDLFLVKYDSDGNKQWIRQKGSDGIDMAFSVAADNSGYIYVAGQTLGELDGNINAGLYDMFVMKYDSEGNLQ